MGSWKVREVISYLLPFCSRPLLSSVDACCADHPTTASLSDKQNPSPPVMFTVCALAESPRFSISQTTTLPLFFSARPGATSRLTLTHYSSASGQSSTRRGSLYTHTWARRHGLRPVHTLRTRFTAHGLHKTAAILTGLHGV